MKNLFFALFFTILLTNCNNPTNENKEAANASDSVSVSVLSGTFIYLENKSYCLEFTADSVFLQEKNNEKIVRVVNKGKFRQENDSVLVEFPSEVMKGKYQNKAIHFENFGGRASVFKQN